MQDSPPSTKSRRRLRSGRRMLGRVAVGIIWLWLLSRLPETPNVWVAWVLVSIALSILVLSKDSEGETR